MKPKKCNPKIGGCGNTFTPERGFQSWCCPDCAINILKHKKEQKKRKDLARRKQELLTMPELLKKAQAAFNTYIRERDKGQPCISCQRHHSGKYDAGHYLTVKARPELRFHEFNCSSQCVPCNQHLSGNIVNYRINLINKIGAGHLEWLEGPHQAQNWTREEVREIEAYYKQKLKQLRVKQ